MKNIKKIGFALLLLGFVYLGYSQETDNKDKYAPIKLNLNENGEKFLRLIFWNQIQAGYNNIGQDNAKSLINMRRLRMLALGRFSPKFLLLLHVGTHSLNAQNTSSGGKDGADIFINDAWGEYMLVDEKLYVGAGIHYWGAISRMQRSSTFKFLAIDNFNTRTWLDIGRTGQFVRQFGLYAKGKLGKLEYNVSINDALNNYAVTNATQLSDEATVYGGAQLLSHFNSEKARYNYTARVEYQLWDQESHVLPYKTGSAFSKKGNILNVGAGIVYHPSAAVKLKSGSTLTNIGKAMNLANKEELDNNVIFENATAVAVDVFLDKKGWTVYGLWQYTNYGTNAGLSTGLPSRFSGTNMTFLAGYLLNDESKIVVQPYAGINLLMPSVSGVFTANQGTELTLGVNFLSVGNFLKTSLEFQSIKTPYLGKVAPTVRNNILLQMQFIL